MPFGTHSCENVLCGCGAAGVRTTLSSKFSLKGKKKINEELKNKSGNSSDSIHSSNGSEGNSAHEVGHTV